MSAMISTDADIEIMSKLGCKSEQECYKALWNYGCKDCEYKFTCYSSLTEDYIIIPWEDLDHD